MLLRFRGKKRFPFQLRAKRLAALRTQFITARTDQNGNSISGDLALVEDPKTKEKHVVKIGRNRNIAKIVGRVVEGKSQVTISCEFNSLGLQSYQAHSLHSGLKGANPSNSTSTSDTMGKLLQFPRLERPTEPKTKLSAQAVEFLLLKVYPVAEVFFLVLGFLTFCLIVLSAILYLGSSNRTKRMNAAVIYERALDQNRERASAFATYHEFEKYAVVFRKQVKKFWVDRGLAASPSWFLFSAYTDLWQQMKKSSSVAKEDLDKIHFNWLSSEVTLAIELALALGRERDYSLKLFYENWGQALAEGFLPTVALEAARAPEAEWSDQLRMHLVKAAVDSPAIFLMFMPRQTAENPKASRQWVRHAANALRHRILIHTAHSMGLRRFDWKFDTEKAWIDTHCKADLEFWDLISQFQNLRVRSYFALKKKDLELLQCNDI